MNTKKIPFNRPYISGKESIHLTEAQRNYSLSGDGVFTKRCHQWLEEKTGCSKALLTHSCTAALEMAALLLDIQSGDEIVMPSYTFVSTANAFVLRGGIPVFVDIRPDTLNINEKLIEAAITPKTKAIVPVHYAGVACEMDAIMAIAARHNLFVIEDAAQGIMSAYKGRVLGSIGHLGVYSFHETKNIISGEGGALLINDEQFIQRAEIIREKGTDRSQFLRGEIDKYTWQAIGSSFLPNELTAAFLWAQLEEGKKITDERLAIWHYYHDQLESLEKQGLLQRPVVPLECQHNGHMYYVILAPHVDRQSVLAFLKQKNIFSVSHYVPLHLSPAGQRYGRAVGELPLTFSLSEQLIRLPLWVGLEKTQQSFIVRKLIAAMNQGLD